jgi:hypothetical protein
MQQEQSLNRAGKTLTLPVWHSWGTDNFTVYIRDEEKVMEFQAKKH